MALHLEGSENQSPRTHELSHFCVSTHSLYKKKEKKPVSLALSSAIPLPEVREDKPKSKREVIASEL